MLTYIATWSSQLRTTRLRGVDSMRENAENVLATTNFVSLTLATWWNAFHIVLQNLLATNMLLLSMHVLLCVDPNWSAPVLINGRRPGNEASPVTTS